MSSPPAKPPPELPPKPEPPLASDCCGSGCAICVYELYDLEVERWQAECERLQQGEA